MYRILKLALVKTAGINQYMNSLLWQRTFFMLESEYIGPFYAKENTRRYVKEPSCPFKDGPRFFILPSTDEEAIYKYIKHVINSCVRLSKCAYETLKMGR